MNIIDATAKTLASRVIVDAVGYSAGYQTCKKMRMSEASSHTCGAATAFFVDVVNNMYSIDDKVINGIKKGANAVGHYIKNEIHRISEAGKKATNMMNGHYY